MGGVAFAIVGEKGVEELVDENGARWEEFD